MKVENVKVYDLEESIIASGYPMRTINMDEQDIKCVQYWTNQSKFLIDFYNYQNNYNKFIGEQNNKNICEKCGSTQNVQFCSKANKFLCSKHIHQIERFGEVFETTPKYELLSDGVKLTIFGDKRKEDYCYISYIDLPVVFYSKNVNLNADGRLIVDGELFHRVIFKDKLNNSLTVDHIDKNKKNNRRNNLRICRHQQNDQNKNLLPTNTSRVTGVSKDNRRNKWRAYITIDNVQKSLGSYLTKEEAIKARLLGEKKLFREYAPQKHLFQQYGIENQEEIINNEQIEDYPISLALQCLRRCKSLSIASNSGNGAHSQALTGIRVAFDLTCSNKMWVEAERYRFLEFVSSQSTMHRITKFDLDNQYNEYVDPRIVKIMKEKIDEYNNLCNKVITDDLASTIRYEEEKKQKYLEILYSNPAGFELTARLTTNYRCLKNIYIQRHDHRLPEWREFCNWIETLPYFKEICLGGEDNAG